MLSSRRSLLMGLCACSACGVSRAYAKPFSLPLQSVVQAGYRPAEPDERGYWQICDKLEEQLSTSSLVMNAPELASYVRSVVENLLGSLAADLRIYLVHDALFNASMTPNGMMVVHTGLIARVRNEAQFAAVLGHEAGHYLRRHGIQRFRELVSKKSTMAFVSAGALVMAGATYNSGGDGSSWINLANSINGSLARSFFSFNREQESEADAFGIQLLSEAGYAPEAAGAVWNQLIAERKASAEQRKKKYKDSANSDWSTHPPSNQRMTDLLDTAKTITRDFPRGQGQERWASMVAPYRALLIEEQVKLNDPGASLHLVSSLAETGWNGTLKYYEGEVFRLRDEPGDVERSARSYSEAVSYEDVPVEAWRGYGYALLKSGRAEEGKTALSKYLEKNPSAPDAAMVRFSAGN